MILGYKAPPGDDPYWIGRVANHDRKFIRVLAGIVLPIYDRQSGAIVVMGEIYRMTGQQDIWGLGAAVGEWKTFERSVLEFDRDLQFGDAIMPTDAERKHLWRVDGLSNRVRSAAAPDYAFSELGRQKVDQMIGEGRLHLEGVEQTLAMEPDMGAQAVQAAICWMTEMKPIYRNLKKGQRPQYDHFWGTVGL